MCGGETGKITFGKVSINLGLRAKTIPSWYNILVHLEGADLKVVDKFMTCLSSEGFGLLLAKCCDRIAALTPCKQKIYSEVFGTHQSDSCLWLIRDVVLK